jgi:hypothetical protein
MPAPTTGPPSSSSATPAEVRGPVPPLDNPAATPYSGGVPRIAPEVSPPRCRRRP